MIRRFLLVFVIFLFFPQMVFAEILFVFEGRANFAKDQLYLDLDFPPQANSFQQDRTLPPEDEASAGKPKVLRSKRPSPLSLSIGRISEKDYRLSLDMEHLKTPLCDLLGKIESSIEVIREGGRAQRLPGVSFSGREQTILRGKIWSQNSLVNYKPIRELFSHFEVKGDQLFLHSLSFGNIVCQGRVELDFPYHLDWKAALYEVDMEDFLNFWVRDNEYESSGTVSGEISVSGTLGSPVLKGSLESHNGFIESLAYNTIYLNAEGIYPKMQITHSTISKTDGVSFSFEGPFDLSGQGSLKKQILALTFAPLVSDSLSERAWTIKRFRQKGAGATEVKYLLRKGDHLGVSPAKESDMLGIERIMKF
jgi:hypothetical protein